MVSLPRVQWLKPIFQTWLTLPAYAGQPRPIWPFKQRLPAWSFLYAILDRIYILIHINSLVPGRYESKFTSMGLSSDFTKCYLEKFVWNWTQMSATKPHWWWIDSGSGNDLESSGNKPLPEPMKTHIYIFIMESLGHKGLIIMHITSQEICIWFILCCLLTFGTGPLPIFFRVTSLALGQSNDCPSASDVTLKSMGKYLMRIHQNSYSRVPNCHTGTTINFDIFFP